MRAMIINMNFKIFISALFKIIRLFLSFALTLKYIPTRILSALNCGIESLFRLKLSRWNYYIEKRLL